MEYKRLTSKDKNGFYHYNCTKKEKKDCCLWESCGECYGSKVLRKLGEIEDDLESGKIIRLPCKVGDTVYEVFKDHIPPFIKETKIKKIVVTGKGLRLRLSRNSFYETAISSLGKTVFLTREEAEAKLKELQNG